MDDINNIATKEFQQAQVIISQRRSQALQAVNNEKFIEYQDKYKLNEIVQSLTAQLENVKITRSLTGQIVQTASAQLESADIEQSIIQPAA